MSYISYDDPSVEQSAGSKFLNLVKKGDQIKVRLATKPQSYFIHWVDGKPEGCTDEATCMVCAEIKLDDSEEGARKRRKQMFVWGVIDREDGEAKVYKAGMAIFREIAKYAKDESWGGTEKDATKFDITITRTELSPQQYYTVVADPKSITQEITEEEKKKVDAISTLIDSVLPGESPDAVDEFTKSLE